MNPYPDRSRRRGDEKPLSFWPATKYVFLEEFLGILGALCKGGKGAILVRYLFTTRESLHMFFTKMCPLGGAKYVFVELVLDILRGAWGSERGCPWYGNHLTEGMFPGSKTEIIQDRPRRLKFSSEIENFKRAAH